MRRENQLRQKKNYRQQHQANIVYLHTGEDKLSKKWTGRELCHNCIDYKKAFDRVWHYCLSRVLKEYNIDNRLIEVIKPLFGEATSAVILKGNAGDLFQTTVGVGQGVSFL